MDGKLTWLYRAIGLAESTPLNGIHLNTPRKAVPGHIRSRGYDLFDYMTNATVGLDGKIYEHCVLHIELGDTEPNEIRHAVRDYCRLLDLPLRVEDALTAAVWLRWIGYRHYSEHVSWVLEDSPP